jgi:hypothetical protein
MRPAPGYWWDNDPQERYWVEIRKVPGTGKELRCALRDAAGRANPWYDLLDEVRANDIIYHWHARESRFVGQSVGLNAGLPPQRVSLEEMFGRLAASQFVSIE